MMIGLFLITTLISLGHATHFITKVNETVHHNVILQGNEPWNPEMYAKKVILRNFTGAINAQSFFLLKHVKELYFAHSSITSMDNDAFKNVPSLKILQFSYNTYLPPITNEILKNCKNLKKFIMGHNKYIEEISDTLFSNIQNLTHIEITQENKFPKRLTRDLFKHSKNVQSIKLHFSNITTIDSEAFKDLPRLQFLSLVENELVEIGTGALSSPRLSEIYLGWNKLDSFTGKEMANLKNLRTLDISFNPLEIVDLQQIRNNAPNLRHLTLKKTDLSCEEKRNIKKQESSTLEIRMNPMEIEKCET